MEILQQSAAELGAAIARRQLSSREVTQAFLDRIAATDDSVRSFVRVDAPGALRQAEEVDRRLAAGELFGSPLAGVPIAIKDNLCTAQGVTSCASRMLEHFRAPYDATAVALLRRAGMVVLGKTNMDEFAMGSSTENSSLGLTRNPWASDRAPGGSSGGSAACVAAAQTPLSLGSDTGGSIRQPASLCGVCGLKPTYGRVSRYGLVAFASSLDQIGPMAGRCEDLAAALQAIAGHDPRDSTSIPQPTEDYVAAIQRPPERLRVGVLQDLLEGNGIGEATRANVEAAVDLLKANGAEIVPVRLPHARYGIPTYYIIASSEASSNLSRYSGAHYGYRAATAGRGGGEPVTDMMCRTRSEGFGAEVKRRIMLGTYTLSAGYYDAYYLKALKVRRLIRGDYDAAFQKVDVLLGPTTPGTAFPLGSKSGDPIAMYLEDLFTVGANLAGIPALSVPSGFDATGLPTAIQLQAPVLAEARLLQCGHWYERWSGRPLSRPVL